MYRTDRPVRQASGQMPASPRRGRDHHRSRRTLSNPPGVERRQPPSLHLESHGRGPGGPRPRQPQWDLPERDIDGGRDAAETGRHAADRPHRPAGSRCAGRNRACRVGRRYRQLAVDERKTRRQRGDRGSIRRHHHYSPSRRARHSAAGARGSRRPRSSAPFSQRGRRGGRHHSAALGDGQGASAITSDIRKSPKTAEPLDPETSAPFATGSKKIVRIIAGEFRHRRLLTNPGLITRPITDRAKEILFERIQDLLVDKRIADIFAGTGSLGLEALSRGAHSVVFLESDKRAFELLEQNVAALGDRGSHPLLADGRIDVLVSSKGSRGFLAI